MPVIAMVGDAHDAQPSHPDRPGHGPPNAPWRRHDARTRGPAVPWVNPPPAPAAHPHGPKFHEPHIPHILKNTSNHLAP